MRWIKSSICFNLNKSNLSNQTALLWHLPMEIQTTRQQVTALDFTLECLPERLECPAQYRFHWVPRACFLYLSFDATAKKPTALFLLKTLEHYLSNLNILWICPHKPACAEGMCNTTDPAALAALCQPGPAPGNHTLVFHQPKTPFQTDLYTSYKSSGLFFHFLLHNSSPIFL